MPPGHGENCYMSTALWIIIAMLAIGTVAGGLMRLRAWLRRPVPPEVIEAARRADAEDEHL